MSSEEMEISTDFGHHGPAEDIDIDFEFAAAGHQDEDLELGDYNQAEEVQRFNSDNRDELMAEDDDASYGMADADDISYNETAAATNDYDIALGDTDVYSWQENDTVIVDEAQIPADQNQDFSGIDDAEAAFELTADDGHEPLLQAQSSTLDSIIPEVSEELVHPDQTSHNIVSTVSITEEESLLDGTTSEGFEVILDKSDQNQVTQNHDTIVEDEDQRESVHILHADGGAQPAQVDTVVSGEFLETDGARFSSLEDQDEDGQDQNTEELEGDDDEIGYDDLEGEENTAEDGAAATTIVQQKSNGPDNVEEHTDLNEGEETFAGGDADFTADGFQLGDNSFEQSEGQNDEAPDESEHHSTSPGLSNPAELAREVQNDSGSNNTANAGGVAENIAVLADRHIIIVHYGETDYQLFASKPDDDPSEYFFKDLSALELPLGEFLSGIRSVISEEVSPLDELSLHIDGLGLEFGESTTSQFLDAYTFGHILSLYDSLIQNDSANEIPEAVDAPELYIYLMLKPNCSQRLKALQVQAASGRSLTDVAVYREASPAEDITNITESAEVLAVSPDYAVHDLYDEEEQLDDGFLSEHAEDAEHEAEDVEHDAEDVEHETEDVEHEIEDAEHETEDVERETDDVGHETEDVEHGTEPAELEETQASLQDSQDNDNHAEETEELASDDIEDAIDYDNLDLTPSQQDIEDNTAELSRIDVNEAITTTDNEATKDDGTVPAENSEHDVPPSESTSATVTIDGEPNDEIDYDENDLDVSSSSAAAQNAAPDPIAKLIPPLDEEITWESENEDARNELPKFSKSSEQVSTTPGKRTRSSSDAVAIAGDRKDVKRQRS